MAETPRVAFRFDEATLAKLDADRGDLTRTEYVRRLINGTAQLAEALGADRVVPLRRHPGMMPSRIPSTLARSEVTPRFKR